MGVIQTLEEKGRKMTNNQNIALGSKVRDRVTGFSGIAISKVIYLNGCVQYCIKPPIKDNGTMIEGEYVDSQRVEVVGPGVLNVIVDLKDQKSTIDPPASVGGTMSDTPPESFS